jgi:hypothetical protein
VSVLGTSVPYPPNTGFASLLVTVLRALLTPSVEPALVTPSAEPAPAEGA